MAFLKKKKDIIALDIGSSSVKIIQLAQTKKGWELQKLGISYLPPEAIVDGSIIDSMTVTNTISELLQEHGVKAPDAASALTGHSVIIKKVAMAAMTEDELAESIQWEAEQYIPFPMTDVNIDFQIIGEDETGSGQMDVMLVAVKKDVINDYTNVIKESGLEPVIIDVDSFACENMIELNYSFGPDDNICLVNIGATVTSVSVITGGVTTFTRSVPMGGNQFTEEIQRSLNVSFQDAEDLKMGKPVEGAETEDLAEVIETASNNLVGEITRSVDFYLGSTPGITISKILLSGGGARVHGLAESLQEKSAIPCELVDPFSAININPKNFDEAFINEMAVYFGVCVGLATRRVGDR